MCSDTTAMHCSTGQINWIPHCSKLLCKTGSQLVWVTAITPMEICCSYRCAVTQQQCTAALGRSTGFPTVQSCSAKQAHSWFGSLQLHLWRFAVHTGVQSPNSNALQHWAEKLHSPLFKAALQNRLTAGLGHCNYTYGDLLFIQVCSDTTAMHCSTGQINWIPHCSKLLCKTGSQLVWVTAITPMEICCSYRCAVTQQQCTAALGRANCIPHCSAALQNRLTAGLGHCNYTYGDLLFIQVCSDTTAMHCSTGQINWIPHCSKLLCKTGSQLVWVTAITPMEICCSYRCAVTQQQCTAALGRANCIPHCSKLLCKTGSQLVWVTAITPMEICCSYRCAVTQQQCTAALGRSTGFPTVQSCSAKQAHSWFGSLQLHLWRFAVRTGVQSPNSNALQHWADQLDSPLFKAALQNRLTAGLGHCNYTYGDLLFIQVCSDTTAMHCSTGQINWIPHCSKLLCKTGSQLVWVTAITPMEICCSYRCAVTQQQCTAALGRANCITHCSKLLCKTGSQLVWVTAITPMEICSSYRCAVTQQQCTAALGRKIAFPTVQSCSAKQAHSWFGSLQLHLWRFAVRTGVQ